MGHTWGRGSGVRRERGRRIVQNYCIFIMTRPRCVYNIGLYPKFRQFKPEGADCRKGECVELTPHEAEALRLHDVRDLYQAEAARRMNVSQSTFQRVLTSAHKKTSEALIKGKVIKISGSESGRRNSRT